MDFEKNYLSFWDASLQITMLFFKSNYFLYESLSSQLLNRDIFLSVVLCQQFGAYVNTFGLVGSSVFR